MHKTVMHHKLRILLLQQLKKKPRAGYGLIKDINEETGWKPSYGSVYPELDRLRREGLIDFKEEGRKKIYSLTTKGQEVVQHLKLHNSEAIEQMDKTHKLILHLCGVKKEPLPIGMMLSQFANPTPEFKEILSHSMDIKHEFARLMKSKLLEKHHDTVCKILDKATNDLSKLK